MFRKINRNTVTTTLRELIIAELIIAELIFAVRGQKKMNFAEFIFADSMSEEILRN